MKTMNTKQNEIASALGLASASDPKSAEYDLVKALLSAADFRNTEDAISEVEIRRNGKYYFTIHVHPIGDDELNRARKQATTYGKNPQGSKYPPIEKSFDNSLFNSWIIYLATVPEEQEKIWGNPSVKEKCGLMQNVESVDALLCYGEKIALLDRIAQISGAEEEESVTPEDYAKN